MDKAKAKAIVLKALQIAHLMEDELEDGLEELTSDPKIGKLISATAAYPFARWRDAMAEFERRYLVHVMERSGGSVSAGSRLTGLDRTNFRRLLQRHGLR